METMVSDTKAPSKGRYAGANERIGLWSWLFLYLSATFLLFFLFVHLFTIHYGANRIISADSVSRDFGSDFTVVINLILLGLATFHGLLGIRRIVLDLEILGKKGDQNLIYVLALIGMGLFLYGLVVYNRFATMGM